MRSLRPVQRLAIELLIAGHSDAAVARHLKVHRVTVTRWRLYNPRFRLELARRRQVVYDKSTEFLQSAMHRVGQVYKENLASPDPGVAYRAARDFLTMIGSKNIVPPPLTDFPELW